MVALSTPSSKTRLPTQNLEPSRERNSSSLRILNVRPSKPTQSIIAGDQVLRQSAERALAPTMGLYTMPRSDEFDSNIEEEEFTHILGLWTTHP